jgi:hypothetical protein
LTRPVARAIPAATNQPQGDADPDEDQGDRDRALRPVGTLGLGDRLLRLGVLEGTQLPDVGADLLDDGC